MEQNKENFDGINVEDLERIQKALKSTIDTSASNAIDKFNYDDTFEPLSYKLIEVTEEIAEHVLAGKEFYISGLPEDQMVMCTKDKTYNGKEVERSNTMLLTNMKSIPENINGVKIREFNVCSILTRNIELTEASLYKPSRLREILTSQQLNLFDDEPMLSEKALNMKQIYSELPLSEKQIEKLLDQYPVFEINEKIYCLNREGRESLIQEIAFFLGECDMERVREFNLTHLPIFTSLSSRISSEVSDSLIKWVVRLFFNPNEDNTYRLNQKHIVREVCIPILFKHASNKFINLAEMEKHYYRLMPTSIPFNVEYLRGIAFCKKAPSGELVMKYLNSEDLPLDDKKRLELLFKTSPVWTLGQIEPYMLDFVEEKGVYEFLTKRCRSGISEGTTLFYPL